MLTKAFTLATAAAMTIAAFAPTAAEARRWHDDGRYYGERYQRGDYYRGGYYDGDRRYASSRRYYGRDHRRYRCDKGTGGTIIGAIAGGLLGHEVANGRSGRGDGTTGAIIGAGVGALAGRAIDRNC